MSDISVEGEQEVSGTDITRIAVVGSGLYIILVQEVANVMTGVMLVCYGSRSRPKGWKGIE